MFFNAFFNVGFLERLEIGVPTYNLDSTWLQRQLARTWAPAESLFCTFSYLWEKNKTRAADENFRAE